MTVGRPGGVGLCIWILSGVGVGETERAFSPRDAQSGASLGEWIRDRTGLMDRWYASVGRNGAAKSQSAAQLRHLPKTCVQPPPSPLTPFPILYVSQSRPERIRLAMGAPRHSSIVSDFTGFLSAFYVIMFTSKYIGLSTQSAGFGPGMCYVPGQLLHPEH